MTGLPTLIYLSGDWLGQRMCFPTKFAAPLKIDGHIISKTARVCLGLELTCPMEEYREVASVKAQKYENETKKNGRRFYSIEVGARGWVPNSVAPALRKLGLLGINSICKKLSLSLIHI